MSSCDSSSAEDGSILQEQAKKLFKYCDEQKRGFIVKADLAAIRDLVPKRDLEALEIAIDDSDEKFISQKEFIHLISNLVRNTAETPILVAARISELPDPRQEVSLADELAVTEFDSKFHDPLSEMLNHSVTEISVDFGPEEEEELSPLAPHSLPGGPQLDALVHDLPTVLITPPGEEEAKTHLGQQLNTTHIPYSVGNPAVTEELPTIFESYDSQVIKKAQFRPIALENGRNFVGQSLADATNISGPSIKGGDELMEAEQGAMVTENNNKVEVDMRTPDRIFKVVFVGDSAVGKTCFLHRFCHNRFKPLFNATIGVDFTVKTIPLRDRMVALQLWDTAGQERFRSITKQYFRKADGVVLMFDVTSEQSFLNVRNWVDSVKAGVDEATVMCLVGNKVDLFGNDETRNSVYRAGRRLAEEFNISFFETSAFTGYGIEHCMRSMAERLQRREDEHLEEALRLEAESPVKRRSWCCL